MDHTDIVCNDDVECDRDKPDYEFRIYLAQFINWFVNTTFREVGFLLDPRRKKSFKIQVFELYSENETNGVFLQLINNFNRYMANNATTIFPHTSIYDMDLYPAPPQLLDRPTADFYNINGQPINTKIINLVIAAHIIHKILSESSERGPVIAPIRVSQLQTYMELLPSVDDEELNDDYLETLRRNHNDTSIRLLQIPTPLQAEIILHAENFEYYKGGRHSILEVRYPGLAIEDNRLPLSSLPHSPHPNGGSKKRNKSKRRKQKRSNKKSRRHHTRKRASRRRNANRFY